MNSRSASLFLILLLPLLSAVVARKGALLGGWKKIDDVNDPHVQEIAMFAVTEYNKQSKGVTIEFKSVVSGETQVVSGINYRLVIDAKRGESVGKYRAMVWEKPWENSKKLTSFKPFA
ncbi:cysteine proteinase inhibitor 1 [Benincasa hispida]|uniref:cysteine proteinase inhibitor 1 n=1 Tax=Benincasa hispida TaxID=102211 RepID=UPI0019007DC3|nr:cysteine proteinase inhibitor 1 [Benincasa hispida]